METQKKQSEEALAKEKQVEQSQIKGIETMS
jgi:hypothetical protein